MHGHPLLDLSHPRQPQLILELGLPYQHDLQQFPSGFEVRQNPNLFQQRQRQVLHLVDDEHGEGFERFERLQELVQRVAEVGSRRPLQPALDEVLDRHHAELDEHRLQQVFAGHEGVWNEGGERLAVELRQHRPTERGLAQPDVAGEHDETFAPADGRVQVLEHRCVFVKLKLLLSQTKTIRYSLFTIRFYTENLLNKS